MLCAAQCGAMIPRVLMQDHLRYTCSRRRANCEHCGKEFSGSALEVFFYAARSISYCEKASPVFLILGVWCILANWAENLSGRRAIFFWVCCFSRPLRLYFFVSQRNLLGKNYLIWLTYWPTQDLFRVYCFIVLLSMDQELRKKKVRIYLSSGISY